MTFGTGAFALMITGDEIHRQPEKGLLPTVAWQLQGEAPVFALDGGVFTASAAINWAKSLGLFADFSQINSFAAPAAFENGLIFVPALSGLGCPHWDADARGTWLGLSLDHGRGHLVQAILEGIAFRAAQVIAAMDDCVSLPSFLPIDGGLSNNVYFNQFLADVLECEIRPALIPEITGLGTAQLAAKSLGYDLPNTMSFGSCRPITPRREAVALFDKACQVSGQWKGLSGGS